MPGNDSSQAILLPAINSADERATAEGQTWHQQGRGWQVWDFPVRLEPPFPQPPPQPQPATSYDDARRPTLIGSLIERLRGNANNTTARATLRLPAKAVSALPEAAAQDHEPLCEIQVYLPDKLKILPEAAEQLLLSLSYSAHPVSFELVGCAGTIVIQFTCKQPDRALLLQQLKSHFSDSVLGEETDLLAKRWSDRQNLPSVIADFGLSQPFVLPIKANNNFESDPLVAFTGALTLLKENDLGLLQVIFQAARQPWAQQVVRQLSRQDGKPLSGQAPEFVSLAKRKIARPLFAVILRVAARSESEQRAWQIVKSLGGALAQFSNPLGNSFIPLSNEGYARGRHELSVLTRQTFRSGMLLSSEELVSVVHPPSVAVRAEELKRIGSKTRPAPTLASGHHLILGENLHDGTVRQVSLSSEQRTRHTYICGATGSGKSTLISTLIQQDIEQGEGVAVFDPHGDLVDQILARIPATRADDVILFDPSDEDFPIGFNILAAHSELERTLIEADLCSIFRRLSTSWGDQMQSVLSNAILAILESERGGTLLDLRRFLVDGTFRKEFLTTVRDQETVFYWNKEFPLLVGRPQAPLLTRLDTFLRPKPIRYMVAQKDNRIDFAEIMNSGKIFLAKLSHGAIGEENSFLLGSLLVAKFHQIALSRQEQEQSKRVPYWLYIDEFQHFISNSLAKMLSGVRKYKLGLVLANQELGQVTGQDKEVAGAVLTNPYTRICFRVGDEDAKKLTDGFTHFDATDLQNLGIGNAICRIERAEFDFNLRTKPLPAIDQIDAQVRRTEIQTNSRKKYARPRAEVEAELAIHHEAIKTSAGDTARPKAEPLPKQYTYKAQGEEKPELVVEGRQVQVSKITTTVPPDLPSVSRKAPDRSATKKSSAGATPLPGRGGQQHQYLQHLFKRAAEERGFRATIEKSVPSGSVDVAFERGAFSLACEISITTTVEHEIGNLKKCLAAGFQQVVIVASEKRTLNKIREAALVSLSEGELARMQFLLPEDFLLYLDKIAAETGEVGTQEGVVKGYKVKVKYKSLTREEQESRKNNIAKTILQAMKRFKETD